MENNVLEKNNGSGNVNRSKWMETVSAILLSAATILSAWCVYESSQWNGEQFFRIEDVNIADRERMQKEIAAYQRLTADAQLFLRYIEAKTNENDEMADFLMDRFPPHLEKAMQAWYKLDPLHNKTAPTSTLTYEGVCGA